MAELDPLQMSPLLLAIREAYVAREQQTPRRTHLGASQVGGDCPRAVWYSWRWAYRAKFSGRMLRLFNTGHREEARITDDLRRTGATVLDLDPDTQKQWRLEDDTMGGHFSGSMDAAANNVPGVDGWVLLEYKTSNTKGWKALKKLGVKTAKPTHFRQMQIYMGWTGLKRAVYICVCKDTDDIHIEVVEFDNATFQEMRKRARMVLEAPVPLAKVANTTMVPPCLWCDAKEICQENKVADVNCRTCVHSTPVLDEPGAKWMCEMTGEYLTAKAQQRGCDEHLFIPALVPYAEAVDSGAGWVKYEIPTKGGAKPVTFLNVASAGFPADKGGDAPFLSSDRLKSVEARDFDGIPTDEELKRGTL